MSWVIRTGGFVAGALLLSTGVAAAAPQAPSDTDEWRMQAQEIAEQGQKLEATDPKRALSAYRSSLEIKMDPKVLYAVGRVCARLADPACAVTAYEQYLRDGGSEITPSRKREVDAALKTLTKGLARLTVKANVDGAIVKVDGNVAGKTPLAQPLALAPGTHVIKVGSEPSVVERTITLEKASPETIEILLKEPKAEEPPPPPPAAAVAEATPPPPPPAAQAKRKKAPIFPWIITGALAAGTGVAAFFTLRAESRYDALRGTYPIQKDALDASHAEGRNLLYLTGALGAATVVSLGVSGALTLFRGRESAPEPRTIGLLVGPGGIAISGTMR